MSSSPVRTVTCSRDPKASPVRGSLRHWLRGVTIGRFAEVRRARWFQGPGSVCQQVTVVSEHMYYLSTKRCAQMGHNWVLMCFHSDGGQKRKSALKFAGR